MDADIETQCWITGPPDGDDLLTALVLHGENSSGEEIYCVLELPPGQVEAVRSQLESGQNFVPSEFGTVLAAGHGAPPESVKAEIARTHGMIYWQRQGEDHRPSAAPPRSTPGQTRSLRSEDPVEEFMIPCRFPGGIQPFSFYVGEPSPDAHPLEQQAAWLERERNGIVPQEVMDSFHKLHEIAKENNVSFAELCVYAMGEASGGESGPAAEPDEPPT